MADTREYTRDLDCPQCGSGVPALRWHEPDEEWPDGEYLAWDGDEHTCPECGWLLQVHADDEQAWLVAVHCSHGRAEDEPCWVCEVGKWPSHIQYWLRRTWHDAVCIFAGHVWRDCDSAGAPWMKTWEACSRCNKVRRKVTP